MSRPDFAALADEHFYDTGWRCNCGWTGSAEEWTHHFAAALDAELDRWLADEGTREVAAQAIADRWAHPEYLHPELVADAAAALAALTNKEGA